MRRREQTGWAGRKDAGNTVGVPYRQMSLSCIPPPPPATCRGPGAACEWRGQTRGRHGRKGGHLGPGGVEERRGGRRGGRLPRDVADAFPRAPGRVHDARGRGDEAGDGDVHHAIVDQPHAEAGVPCGRSKGHKRSGEGERWGRGVEENPSFMLVFMRVWGAVCVTPAMAPCTAFCASSMQYRASDALAGTERIM